MKARKISKIFSLLLVVSMILAILPFTAVPSSAAALSYDSSIAEESVYLGGVKLVPGKYLPVGAGVLVDEKPEGGYAYFYEDEYSKWRLGSIGRLWNRTVN